MKCLNPVTIVSSYSDSEKQTVYSTKRNFASDCEDGYLVACGQCIACRINRKRMWSLRCAHEAKQHAESCFVTLTYNPENLPNDLSISKRHLQLFIKSLRKKLSPLKIRYYACGEYGQPSDLEKNLNLSLVGRPHYHLLIFGWYPPDAKALPQRSKHVYYTSELISKAWKEQGFVVIGSVTPESAAYVAGYCTKKITGTDQEEHYTRIHPDTGEKIIVTPEFQTCSQGLGRNFVDKYATDLQKGFITFDAKTYPIPRYYLKRLNKKFESLPLGAEKAQLAELIDNIQQSRASPDSFEVLPDFENLQYQYDVAKLYQERAKERDSLKQQF